MMESLDVVKVYVKYYETTVEEAIESNANNGAYDELDIEMYKKRLNDFKKIEKDLKNHNKICSLINEMKKYFDLSCEDYIDNRTEEVREEYCIEFEHYGKHVIDEALFNIFQQLFRLVGDNK